MARAFLRQLTDYASAALVVAAVLLVCAPMLRVSPVLAASKLPVADALVAPPDDLDQTTDLEDDPIKPPKFTGWSLQLPRLIPCYDLLPSPLAHTSKSVTLAAPLRPNARAPPPTAA